MKNGIFRKIAVAVIAAVAVAVMLFAGLFDWMEDNGYIVEETTISVEVVSFERVD